MDAAAAAAADDDDDDDEEQEEEDTGLDFIINLSILFSPTL